MISLREYRDSDIPLLVEYLNNPRVTQYLTSSIPQPYSLDDATWWVEEGSKEGIVKAVDYDGIFVGTVSVRPGSFESSRSGEIGYWFGEPFWGKGLATQTISAMTDTVFETTDIVRLFAPVFSPNEASKRVLENCGYHLESIQEKACFKHGVFYDSHIYVKLSL
ncbi:MAG: GNAT family N-acetyltransferase [Natronospirillum sp.]|uniref:GNAT family N-acetyltransferase n=1 Tax=Natronospirillum sp. TaxID=2812955 RepID=UPI0025F14FF7|nr:GNAT family protein [Natronospirillum sp.]MCH8551412.1 GNAT family N-acetyltransferase [Natronospirillum sp.]